MSQAGTVAGDSVCTVGAGVRDGRCSAVLQHRTKGCRPSQGLLVGSCNGKQQRHSECPVVRFSTLHPDDSCAAPAALFSVLAHLDRILVATRPPPAACPLNCLGQPRLVTSFCPWRPCADVEPYLYLSTQPAPMLTTASRCSDCVPLSHRTCWRFSQDSYVGTSLAERGHLPYFRTSPACESLIRKAARKVGMPINSSFLVWISARAVAVMLSFSSSGRIFAPIKHQSAAQCPHNVTAMNGSCTHPSTYCLWARLCSILCSRHCVPMHRGCQASRVHAPR